MRSQTHNEALEAGDVNAFAQFCKTDMQTSEVMLAARRLKISENDAMAIYNHIRIRAVVKDVVRKYVIG